MIVAAPDIIADSTVGARLLESDLEGKLATLPEAALVADEAPQVLASEGEDDDLPWSLKADLADLSQRLGPDSFLSPAIWVRELGWCNSLEIS